MFSARGYLSSREVGGKGEREEGGKKKGWKKGKGRDGRERKEERRYLFQNKVQTKLVLTIFSQFPLVIIVSF